MFHVPIPRLIAHRGYTVPFPENSLAAFEAAGKAGYWAIETDIHLTSDGELVCNHDERVDFMYHGSGCIRDMPLRSLRSLELRKERCPTPLSGTIYGLPTFAQYLEICQRFHAIPFIESKCDAIGLILNTATDFFSEDEIIISSISLEHLKKARALSSRVFIHHIFSHQEAINQLSDLGHAGVSLNYPDLDDLPDNLVTAVHQKGLKLCLRAGDSPEAVRQMIAIGLDYIPTNTILPNCV